MIEVQEQIGGVITLLTPSRELISRGRLLKISSKTNKHEERVVFLFSDLLLLCSERTIGFAKYKLRAIFHTENAQVCITRSRR